MSIEPLLTFKAGICDLDESTNRVTPRPEPGYIYLYPEDDVLHFCWRARNKPLDDPEIDLLMFPEDGTFTPYQKTRISGRIWVLKFSSSSQRHLFWMQSKSQAPNGDPKHFSSRDLKLGEIVGELLKGQDVDVQEELAKAKTEEDDEDDDETMEDVEGVSTDRFPRGGAGDGGAGATGGDYRAEGEGPREGGASGGRAPGQSSDAQSVIQNFIQSMSAARTTAVQQPTQGLSTTLQDLLPSKITIPWAETVSEAQIDQLLQYLPAELTTLARDSDTEEQDDRPLSFNEKKDVLKRVLRSPQFAQSMASLTFALRDGGLPSISEALNIPVQNGGYMRRGGVPLGGEEAVAAFLNGVKDKTDQEEQKK